MRSQHFWHRSAPNRILLLLGRIPVSFTLDFFLLEPNERLLKFTVCDAVSLQFRNTRDNCRYVNIIKSTYNDDTTNKF